MKISIVTATYNSGATLRDTLESILAQTYQDYEVLIQDGGSKDNTLQIVDEYVSRFNGKMKVVSERDNGLYDAMNRGMARATGDVVGILNSDDLYYDSSVLESINSTFEKYNCDCTFANLVYVNQNDVNKIVRTWHGSPYDSLKYSKGWCPAHPTFYLKRSCLESYGGFNLNYQVSADFELMLRMLEVHHISSVFIDKCLVRMRVGGESNGSIKNVLKGNMNILKAFKNNGLSVSPLYPLYRLLPKIYDLLKNMF